MTKEMYSQPCEAFVKLIKAWKQLNKITKDFILAKTKDTDIVK